MSEIQYKSKRDSDGQAPNEGWSIGPNVADDDKDAIKLLIQQANTADLLTILKSYGVEMSDGYGGRKCCCPFPGHNDKSPSFFYYGETNSFNCFGCHSGGKPVQLVSIMEGLTSEEAAKKIVANFYIDNTVEIESNKDYFDRQSAILEFSSKIRTFMTDNAADNNAIEYAEKLTMVFDTMTEKHTLEVGGLKKLIEKLSKKLEQY